MMENDMKRNGSGYYDETPVKSGVLSGPQPGEIWTTTQGKEFLILKNHGGYCNTLSLRDSTTHADNIEVVSREVRWVNPVMIGYLANREMVQFVKAVPEEKYMEIMETIGERLGVTIRVSGSNGHNLEELTTAGNEDLLGECARLECRIDEWKAKCSALETERDALQAELKDSEDMYHLACKTCNEEKAARKMAEDDASNMHFIYTKAEENAAMWEKMYNALLDRLFARGEAK